MTQRDAIPDTLPRRQGQRLGWTYGAIGLFAAVDGFSGVYAISALLVAPGSLPAGLAFAWIQTWTWAVVVGLLVIFLPLLYPTGRLLSRRWRPVAVFALGRQRRDRDRKSTRLNSSHANISYAVFCL